MNKLFICKVAMIVVLCIAPVYQQIYWWTHGCISELNVVISLLWLLACVGICILIVNLIFPKKKDVMKKFKYVCRFYSIKGLKYVRVCTRTKWSVLKYCVMQILHGKALYFTISKSKKKSK